MSTNPDNQTKEFVDRVKELENTGVVKNREEIIKAINWNKASMSTTMTGKQNVPAYIYKRFMDIYFTQTELNKPNGSAEPNGDYKDKYIAVLEKQLASKEGLERELKELREQILTSRTKYDRTLKDVHAYLQTIYWRSVLHFSKTEKADPEQVMNDMDRHLAALLSEA